jgi:hypothetical protein
MFSNVVDDEEFDLAFGGLHSGLRLLRSGGKLALERASGRRAQGEPGTAHERALSS